MNTKLTVFLTGIICLVAGCKLLDGPPKAWEQRYYDITTNEITMVTWQTNAVTLTNYQEVIVKKEVPGTTNLVNVTNVVPVLAYQTNVVSVTNVVESYNFTPNQKAKDEIIGKATDVGGYAGPLAGQAAGWLATIGVGLYGVLRSRKNKKTAEVLAQSVQVAREVMKNNPATASAEAAFKDYLIRNQSITGTFKAVNDILKDALDGTEAKQVADTINKPKA